MRFGRKGGSHDRRNFDLDGCRLLRGFRGCCGCVDVRVDIRIHEAQETRPVARRNHSSS